MASSVSSNTAQRMPSCRSGDYVFRVGGEEFLALLVDIAPEKASKVAKNLRATIEKII